jgi:mono/diheme cytochrome c family protein
VEFATNRADTRGRMRRSWLPVVLSFGPLLTPLAALASLAVVALACTESAPDTPQSRGRKAFVGYCSACHGLDPALDTPLGPAIVGASLELLEARVLRGTYPDGYRPKRDTKLMVAIPQAESALADLAAYLNP